MSYIALQNTCTVSTLAKQSSNNNNNSSSKPQPYTPSKALKKAFKLLGRLFKSSHHQSSARREIKISAKEITAKKSEETLETNECSSSAESSTHNDSILSTCSTLSAEECENYFNELAELAALAKLNAE